MRSDVIPDAYLPAADALPAMTYDLPELDYPEQLNAAAELLDGATTGDLSDRVAFHTDAGTITYGQLARGVHAIGAGLRELGLRPGDRVLLRLPDGPDLARWLLALQLIGAVPVPTFTLARAADLVYRENDTEAVAVVVAGELVDEVEQARAGFRHVRDLIAVPGTDVPGYRSADELIPERPGELVPAPTSRDDLALILYTSGSTGEPKGCWHTHADVLATADSYARYCVRPTPDDVFAGPPPIPFALGYGFFVVFPLRFGAAAVLTTNKSPERMLRAVEEHGVTVLTGVSTYFGMLTEEVERTGHTARTGSLRLLLCGGEPLPDRIARRCEDMFGLPLVQFLGTTEHLHNIVSYQVDESPRPGSFGRAVPGYEVVVRDPATFSEVPDDTPGLLTVRGPTGTKYWRKPDQQDEAVREGWCIVKDIVSRDADGYLHYVSRSDEMIVSSGYNIAPADVEGVLGSHPAVLHVACIGAADPTGRRSTVVKACVVLRAGHDASDALVSELQAFVKASAQPWMYPRLVEFVPELPRTMTGKIRRAELSRRENAESAIART